MEELFPRYLVSFQTAHLPHVFTDVLIIGSGVAGLRAALETAPRLQTYLVTKGTLMQSNTYISQGGIAFPLGSKDALKRHIQDTLEVGQGLCEPRVVSSVIGEGKKCFEELVAWGIHLDRSPVGRESSGRREKEVQPQEVQPQEETPRLLAQTPLYERGRTPRPSLTPLSEGKGYDLALEGGHSQPRIVHHGDRTGKELLRTLMERAQSYSSFTLREHTWVLDLLCEEDRNSCTGVLAWNEHQGCFVIAAGAVILACGGCGQVFRESTNAWTVTGDGMALAGRAGAVLQDMEFMQFHPTCLYVAGAARALISETVRGEGATLIDGGGNRFMKTYHPGGELAPRDVMSRAITEHIARRGETNVFLDLRMFSRERLQKRFPTLYTLCEKFRLDTTREPIPVRPVAHYFIGGVKIDLRAQTSIPNLYACGEVASSGFHGANRLGSNSLLEGLVFGRRAGREALERCRRRPPQALKISSRRSSAHAAFEGSVEDIRNALRSGMSRYVGVIRDRAGLEKILEHLQKWGRYVLPAEFTSPAGWELQNLFWVSWLMARAALRREESRGVHYRSDFPQRSPRWDKKHGVETLRSP